MPRSILRKVVKKPAFVESSLEGMITKKSQLKSMFNTDMAPVEKLTQLGQFTLSPLGGDGKYLWAKNFKYYIADPANNTKAITVDFTADPLKGNNKVLLFHPARRDVPVMMAVLSKAVAAGLKMEDITEVVPLTKQSKLIMRGGKVAGVYVTPFYTMLWGEATVLAPSKYVEEDEFDEDLYANADKLKGDKAFFPKAFQYGCGSSFQFGAKKGGVKKGGARKPGAKKGGRKPAAKKTAGRRVYKRAIFC